MKISLRFAFSAILIAVVLAARASHAAEPQPFFSPDGSIQKLQTTAQGKLVVYWEKWRVGKVESFRCTEFIGARHTERVLDTAQWRWKDGQNAWSRSGWQVVLPPPDGTTGDLVFDGHGDSDEDYSLNRLRLISPQGKIRVLQELPMFARLFDLRFSPDGREVLALTTNALCRYEIFSKRVRRVVRPGGGKLSDDLDWWKKPAQLWVNSTENSTGSGAAISPDGRFIAGFSTNRGDTFDSDITSQQRSFLYSVLVIFDALKGTVVRRLALPLPPSMYHWERRAFQARFTADGSHILVEGPNWDKVLCVRFTDGAKVSTFDWEQRPFNSSSYRPAPILSPDGLYFCDEDGADIVVRSVLSGAIVRRAKGALAGVTLHASGPMAAFESSRLPPYFALAPDLCALYFSPVKDNIVDNRLWRWPLLLEKRAP